jgi:hypothetical protein
MLNNVQTNTINVTINPTYKTENLKNLMYIPIEKLVEHGRLDSPIIGSAFTLINDFTAGVQAGSGSLNQYVISKLNTKLSGRAYLDEAVAFVTTPNVTTYNALYDAKVIKACYEKLMTQNQDYRICTGTLTTEKLTSNKILCHSFYDDELSPNLNGEIYI